MRRFLPGGAVCSYLAGKTLLLECLHFNINTDYIITDDLFRHMILSNYYRTKSVDKFDKNVQHHMKRKLEFYNCYTQCTGKFSAMIYHDIKNTDVTHNE